MTANQDQVTKGDGAIQVVAMYDELGRPNETDQYESSTQYIATTTAYNSLGLVQQTTNPSRPGDLLNYPTKYTYDALGRVTNVLTADLAQTIANYVGNQTTVTDAMGNARATTTNALGQLTSTTENPGGLAYLTSYTYDALNDLVGVAQGAQTRTFYYDSLGHLTSATNPETGTTGYAYDNNGNLIWRRNNAGVKTCYSYDALNRLILQVYFIGNPTGGTTGQCASIPSTSYYGSTPNVSYLYDYFAVNAIGRLVVIQNSAATNWIFGYDALGRAVDHVQALGADQQYDYQFTYTYNLADALTSTTYPSGRVVTTGYDQANRPSGLSGTLNSTSTQYLANITYAPHGGWAGQTYNNNQMGRLFTYNNRLQPTEMKDGVPTLNGSTVASVPNPLLDLPVPLGLDYVERE